MQMRILASLMEKERTTPDNYPLTLNALLLACNQSTNRQPVVQLDDKTVENALLNLRGMSLVRIDHSRSNRADKYRQVLDEALALDEPEAAVLCVLMLRGPQTPGELRSRTERLHPFADQEEVDDALRRLARRTEPLVVRLERQAGQKESRWAQLVGGSLPPGEVATAAGAPDDGDTWTGPAPTGPAPTGTAPTGPAPTGAAPTGPFPTDTGWSAAYAPAVPTVPTGPSVPARRPDGQGGDSERRIAALEVALAAVRDDLDRLRADYDSLAGELR